MKERIVDAMLLTVLLVTVVTKGCFIVPACYAYFSRILGRKVLNSTTISTLCLIPLVLVPDLRLVGPGGWMLDSEALVIVVQALIVFRRIVLLFLKMRRYELRYTTRVKLFIIWGSVSVAFAILRHSLPESAWEGSGRTTVYFIVYSSLVLAGLIFIALGVGVKGVVTLEGDEAVQVDRFIDTNRDLARKMRELFENECIYLRQGLVIDDVVEMLGTNRTYFTRMMRLEFGLSFTQYVQARRIEYCKKMLRESGQSQEEIAFASGFGSASNFNRVFRKCVGETPEQYRKQHHLK